MATRLLLVAALAFLTAAPATALDVTLSGAAPTERIEARYSCADGREVPVTYLNSGDISLALMAPEAGEPLVFARVVSGSGSRYVANFYEWWIKGDSATLSDVREGVDATGISCETTS